MTDFMLLFRTTFAEQDAAMGTPEAARQSLQYWLTWMRSLESAGRLKDPGQPLGLAGKVVRGKPATITDGPFVETKDMLLGFIIIRARDLDDAATVAAGCPIVESGGSAEVRPIGTMPA